MQTIEQLAGASGKRATIIKSTSGERVVLDWYVYGKSGKFETGGSSSVLTEEQFPEKYESAKAFCLKEIT